MLSLAEKFLLPYTMFEVSDGNSFSPRFKKMMALKSTFNCFSNDI